MRRRHRTAATTAPTQFGTSDCGCDTYADDDPAVPDLAGQTVVRWSGVVAVEGVPTGDGRMIAEGALRWGDLPLPLRWAREDEGGHYGAVVVGRITTLRRAGGIIEASGDFDLGSEEGREAARQVREGLTTGVSVDLDDVDLEVRVAADVLDVPAVDDPAEAEVDADGMVVVAEINSDDELLITRDARVRAATIVATPAFVEVRLQVDGEDQAPDDDETDDTPDDEVEETLAASAVRRPPVGWFADPGLSGPTPLTVDDDGRVYGHLATWGVCHTGFPQECVTAPQSPSGYAYFRTGMVVCEDGSEVPTGRVTMDTLHAGRRLGAADTAAHYEHTGIAVADVAAGEDAHGIWIAGALRPTVTSEQVDVLRASPLSGDWRSIGGSLELVAALAVNSPGFPIPRAMVASGRVRSLQGLPSPTGTPATDGVTLTDDDLTVLARLAARERAEAQARQDQADRARLRMLVASAHAKVRGR